MLFRFSLFGTVSLHESVTDRRADKHTSATCRNRNVSWKQHSYQQIYCLFDRGCLGNAVQNNSNDTGSK